MLDAHLQTRNRRHCCWLLLAQLFFWIQCSAFKEREVKRKACMGARGSSMKLLSSGTLPPRDLLCTLQPIGVCLSQKPIMKTSNCCLSLSESAHCVLWLKLRSFDYLHLLHWYKIRYFFLRGLCAGHNLTTLTVFLMWFEGGRGLLVNTKETTCYWRKCIYWNDFYENRPICQNFLYFEQFTVFFLV